MIFYKEVSSGTGPEIKIGPRFSADAVPGGGGRATREATVLYIILRYKSHRMFQGGEMKIEIPERHCSVKIYLLDILRARDGRRRRRTDIAIMLRHIAR